MVFSSAIFIFFFLPLAIAGYFLIPSIKWKNFWLLVISLFFYAWGGLAFLPVILYSILLNYIGGYLLEIPAISQKVQIRKGIFTVVVILNLLNLVYWKYTEFLMQTFCDLTGIRFQIPEIVLPIGISFFTFQGMSYVIDVYRKNTAMQRNILKLGLYISLFPQLIAGPIVRYSDIEKQLNERSHKVDYFASGIRIFTIGLAKKAILANSAGITADAIFKLPPWQNEPVVAWLGVIFMRFNYILIFPAIVTWRLALDECLVFSFRKTSIIHIYPVQHQNFGEDGIFRFPYGSVTMYISH